MQQKHGVQRSSFAIMVQRSSDTCTNCEGEPGDEATQHIHVHMLHTDLTVHIIQCSAYTNTCIYAHQLGTFPSVCQHSTVFPMSLMPSNMYHSTSSAFILLPQSWYAVDAHVHIVGVQSTCTFVYVVPVLAG